MENTQPKRHRYSWSAAEDLLLKETFEKTPASHRDSQIKYLAQKIGRTEIAVKQRYELYFSKKAKKSIKRVETPVQNKPVIEQQSWMDRHALNQTSRTLAEEHTLKSTLTKVKSSENNEFEIESTRVEMVKALFSELSLREKIKVILSVF